MLSLFRSIRFKLALWYSVILLSTLAAFGMIAYAYMNQKISKNLDLSLTSEVRWLQNLLEPKVGIVRPSRKFGLQKKASLTSSQSGAPVDTGQISEADEEIWEQIYKHALHNPKKTLIEVTNRYGAIMFHSSNLADEELSLGEIPSDSLIIKTIRRESGGDLRMAGLAGKNLEIFVAYPLSELNDALDNLFSIFLVLVPITFVVSLGGGWLLSYKSLHPVDVVTRAARQITAHNLDQRIPESLIDDEIGRLITTLNDMIARLRESFDQIKQFSVDASHELRTPLAILRGEIELALKNPKKNEEYRDVLASNLEEILRLSSIVDTLLLLAKGDLGQQDLRFEHVNVRDLLQELYEDAEILALRKDIVVTMSKAEDVSIWGDRLRLRQLFLNLIDNAIKYTPEKGKVSLSLEREDGFAAVKVQDTGVGISSEHQALIFGRFFRVDRARSREMGGSGLGLSIAKWIVDVHHGKIDVASEPNEGSTFSVYLPLEPAEETATVAV